jgi:hypothetical protein
MEEEVFWPFEVLKNNVCFKESARILRSIIKKLADF